MPWAICKVTDLGCDQICFEQLTGSWSSGRQQTVPRFVRTLFGVRVFSKGVARMLAFGLWRVHVEGEAVERMDRSEVA